MADKARRFQAFNFRKKAEKKPGELYENGGQIRCKQKTMW